MHESCSATFPRHKICVTPAARFGFHLARRQDATQMLWSAYQADIRSWIDAQWRPEEGFYLDGCSGRLSIFQKVLTRDRIASTPTSKATRL